MRRCENQYQHTGKYCGSRAINNDPDQKLCDVCYAYATANKERDQLRAEKGDLKQRNRMLRRRIDLPADRLELHDTWTENQANLRAELQAAQATVTTQDTMLKQSADKEEQLRAENERLLELVAVAECPQCDGRGHYAVPDGRGGCDAEQCQWCFETEDIRNPSGTGSVDRSGGDDE